MKKIAVIGGGSWGTALAINLGRNGHEVRLWDRKPEQIAALTKDKENKRYLPGCSLCGNIRPVSEVEKAVSGAEIVLFATPAQHFRSVVSQVKPYMEDYMLVIDVAKGIEQKTLKLMSEIAEELMPENKYVVLSGPSHAEEVGRALPTTVVSASKSPEAATVVQDVFMNENFRVYTNSDVCGVELGGALKNIIALGAGISDGMGFGDNAKAALMTRGIVEISRLGIKLGAQPETFSGLAGIGDLIVTCTSMHSRNRRCGIMIGEGMSPAEATEKVGMVVEGMYTTEAAFQLSKQVGVQMPITEAIYEVINGRLDAKTAVGFLMGRDKKHERA